MAVKSFNLKVCCWNILADVYSHRQLQKWESRIQQIEKFLFKSNAELICLQEVDHFKDSFSSFFKSVDYDCIYFQRPEREDGCLIAYKRNLFEVGPVDYVSFDDIASIMAGDPSRDANYKKRNIAMFTHFKAKQNNDGENFNNNDNNDYSFIVANTHIYWNPNKPKVKLTQTQYFIDRLKHFMNENNLSLTTPVIATGDFNSLPESELYNYLTRSTGFNLSPGISYVKNEFYGPDTKFLCDHSLSRLCRWMRILGIDTAMYDKDGNSNIITSEFSSNNSSSSNGSSSSSVAQIDPVGETIATANSDTTTTSIDIGETSIVNPELFISPSTSASSSSSSSSSSSYMSKNKKAKSFDGIFSRAKSENRVILTTSKQMTERSQCPQARLIQSSKLKNLELELAKICRTYNLKLNPDRFLTVCGKCGGEIELCDIKDIQLYHNSAFMTSSSLVEEDEVDGGGEEGEGGRGGGIVAGEFVISSNMITEVNHSDNKNNNNSNNKDNTMNDDNSNTVTTITTTTTSTTTGGISADLLMNRKIKFLPTDRPVYKCADCHQPYWWSDRESSSPARAMRMADKLHKVVVKHLHETDNQNTHIHGDEMNVVDVEVEVAELVSGKVKVEVEDGSISNAKMVATIADDDDEEEDDEEEERRMEGRTNNKFSKVTNVIGELFMNRDKFMLNQQQQQQHQNDNIMSNSSTSTDSNNSSNNTNNIDNNIPFKIKSKNTLENMIASVALTTDEVDNSSSDEDGTIIHFTSAYLKRHGQEPLMTNWCEDFKGTLDYIFVSDSVQVKEAYVIPRVQNMKVDGDDSFVSNIEDGIIVREESLLPSTVATSAALVTSAAVTSASIVTEKVVGGDDDLINLEVTSSQPSSDWPSDHFMILVDLEIRN